MCSTGGVHLDSEKAVGLGSDGENKVSCLGVRRESVMDEVLLAVQFHYASCCHNRSGRTKKGLSECCCMDLNRIGPDGKGSKS